MLAKCAERPLIAEVILLTVLIADKLVIFLID